MNNIHGLIKNDVQSKVSYKAIDVHQGIVRNTKDNQCIKLWHV